MNLKYKIIVFVSLALSVISITILLFSLQLPLDPDALPVIVGVLALLVTVLIGWQIFSLFEFKNEIKEITQRTAIQNALSDSNMAQMFISMSDFYYMRLTNDHEINDAFKYTQYTLLALHHAANVSAIDVCNTLVKSMLEVLARPKEIYFRKDEKSILMKHLSQIKYDSKIDRFEELVCRIAECQVENP